MFDEDEFFRGCAVFINTVAGRWSYTWCVCCNPCKL